MKFEGWRGSIEIVGSTIVITKKPAKEGRTIPLSQIVATKIEKPGLTSNGFLFVETVGSTSTSKIRSKWDYATDQNAVFFTRSQYEEAKIFKTALDHKLQDIAVQDNKPSSNLSDLKELKELLDIGAITQEEFDIKKSQILGL